jgi:ubiquinol-cytochrome c reductase cytochrome b subunit
VIRKSTSALDDRTGIGPMLAKALRYPFPENWSFLLGEIALYSFVILVLTGIYLTLFFDPSLHTTVYHGSYAPLEGAKVSDAYGSTVHLSLDVRAGLLVRQTHHWAALVFIAAITLHLMRIFFTGAFRKPRELNYVIGLTMLTLAILEGFFGYSLPDDLLSGMGLAIAYSVAMSIPVIGEDVARWLWGGQFPGSHAFESRMYIIHVLLIPGILGLLIAVHLALIMVLHHTQFAGPGRRERNVVGLVAWPSYALRSIGLFFAVAASLFALGGLVQINPIWQYGPYEPWVGTNGVQPDWYMGWLIGALRLMPNFEPTIGGYTIPNPFWGGVLFPLVTFGILYVWPWAERWVSGDRSEHHLLQRPRDNPWRTALGAALFTWVVVPFVAGSSDRIFVTFDIPYPRQVDVLRAAWWLLPPIVFAITFTVCRHLRETEVRPLQGWTGRVVSRTPDGGFVEAGEPTPDP